MTVQYTKGRIVVRLTDVENPKKAAKQQAEEQRCHWTSWMQ